MVGICGVGQAIHAVVISILQTINDVMIILIRTSYYTVLM